MEQGTVRSLRLPELGVILQHAPQRPKHLTAPKEQQLAEYLPVMAIGK